MPVRLAVLSLRDVRPVPWFGGLVDAENVLVRCFDADLHHVELASPAFDRRALRSNHVRRALGSTRLAHPYRVRYAPGTTEPADVLLVVLNDMHDAAVLLGLPDWHRAGQQVVMYVTELPQRDLWRYREVLHHLRRRVDHLFVGTENVPPNILRSGRLRTVDLMPPLLDVLAFPARSLARDRAIDVFNPGRRSSAQHQLLTDWAQSHDGFYMHDTGRVRSVTSLPEHRRLFATVASRAKIFIANYAAFDLPQRFGAFREISTRCYEAMAAGCVLAGEAATTTGTTRELAGTGQPTIEFPLDATRLPDQLVEVLGDPECQEKLGRINRAAALRHIDVAHRWRDMAARIGLLGSPAIDERIRQLSLLADEVLR